MAGINNAVPAQLEVATEKKEIRPLTTFQALSENEQHYVDRVEALRLIADSVAQQRQDASRAIITNPISIAVVLVVFAVFCQYFDDLVTAVTTTAGCLMAGMAGVGYLTYGYLDLAEKTGTWSFLGTDKEEDILLVTKYGDEIVGALVLRLVPVSEEEKPTKMKAVIRAWTIKQRYRNKGLGSALLEDAVALCRKSGWEGPEFAPNHANSTRILPKIFQKNLDRVEMKAQSLLGSVKAEACKKE